MENGRLIYPPGFKEDHPKELFVHKEEAFNLQFGTVFLKKGTRIPETGFKEHKNNVNLIYGKYDDKNRKV